MMPNADALPLAISQTKKREALNALLARMRTEKMDGQELVRRLCADVIEDPGFRASRTHICKEYLAIDAKDPKNVGHVRDLWKTLKVSIDALYSSGKITTPVRIHLFSAESTGPQHTVEFLRNVPNSRATDLSGEADKLWQQMIHALPVNELLFLYKTHAFAESKSLDEGAELWAGSGEVEAVMLLTAMLTKKQPELELGIRRWRDMNRPSLEKKKRCLVLLGSAISDPQIQDFKDRDGWRERQLFHFESVEGGRCCIRKGKRNAPPDETDLKIEYRDEHNPSVDIALVSFFRDIDNGQSIIALQGITTVATLGAARFMCSDRGAREIHRKLEKRTDLTRGLPSFELILSMPVDDGMPKDPHLEEIEHYQGEFL